MRSRKSRLAAIIDILNHNNISCQDELSKQLATKGFIVTQATLSRDLKKLKTTKVANDMGGYRYIVSDNESDRGFGYPDKSTVQSALHPAVILLRISGNMMVIKTRIGYASGVAYDLDNLDSPLILGSISGADTIFAMLNESATREDVYSLLENFLLPEVIEDAKANS